MTRKLIALFAIIVILILLTGFYNISLNNREVSWPDRQQLDSALVKAIDWLHANQSVIETNHNFALWWMMKEASDISDKPDLDSIYAHYRSSVLDKHALDVWSSFFTPYYKPDVPDMYMIQDLLDYQIFFIYSLSCDANLAAEAVIQKQLKADFCNLYFLRSRCATHQQLAVRLQQQRNCGDQKKLASLSSELIDIIHTKQIWDFRVGDAYLQRNLVLAEAGRIDLIKPVWIQRILDAQNPDGGWDDIHPIANLGEYTTGLSSTMPVIKKPDSTFHATAQGVWLLSLLLNQQKPSAL